MTSPDNWNDKPRVEDGVRALDREAASAAADGLDSGRASATLLQSGECLWLFGGRSQLFSHSKELQTS
jgi:hypothetical protein